jgi:hypothetical protein
MQNITLSLPKRTLRKIKLIAVQRQTSVSALLAQMLEDLVDDETGYARARKRQLEMMEQGFDLGLEQSRPVSREELHERSGNGSDPPAPLISDRILGCHDPAIGAPGRL